jgi:hypothetical protein
LLFTYTQLTTVWNWWWCHGNERMGSPWTVVEMRNILCCCEKYKLTEVFISKPRQFCATLTKCVVPVTIFLKIPSIKVHANPSGGSRTDTSTQTDRLTETAKAFSMSMRACTKRAEEEDNWKRGVNNNPLKLTLIYNKWWQQLATEQSVVMAIDSNTFIFLNSFTKFLHVMLRKISFGASPGDDQACTYCIN